MAKKIDQHRREGRATIYFQPSLKAWLEENGNQNGRSLSSHVAHVVESWAQTNGYVKPERETDTPLLEEVVTTESILLKIAELLKGAASCAALCVV
jgi:hypothetical protein